MKLSRQEITQLREEPELITSDLIQSLRQTGNKGKHQALQLLDMPKNQEQYYLDQFGNRIAFNGNRGLKGAYTQHQLLPIHEEEIAKCQADIHYFKANYIQIITPKGVDFPQTRSYQDEFLDVVSDDDNVDICALMPRQSGKSVSTQMFLAWTYVFKKDLNIGIVQNRGKTAREFLDKTKQIIINLPIWMQPGTEVWNKSEIENEAGVKIMTDVPSVDSFRGSSVHLLVVDEAAFIRTSVWEEFQDSIFPSQSGLAWKKNILLSTQNGQNHFYDIVQGARENSNGFVPYETHWTEPPRYKQDGSLYTPEEFKKDTIQKYGEIYFNQNYQCVAGQSKVTVRDKTTGKIMEVTVEELTELLDRE